MVRRERELFITFADFCGIDSPIMWLLATNVTSLTAELGMDTNNPMDL